MTTPTEMPLARVEDREVLRESDLWCRHEPAVWRARRFEGNPHFYPVYRFADYYSYSPLQLILLKRRVVVDRRAYQTAKHPAFEHLPAGLSIDREITPLGRPVPCHPRLREPAVIADRMAEALSADVSTVEQLHPQHVNVVLCGGKDSLNLLFLPWSNPTIVASAAPNYDLVRHFVDDNGLGFSVLELTDDDPSTVSEEILANCCRMTLEHFRWGSQLKRISDSHANRVVFWSGQHADAYFTPYWRTYRPTLTAFSLRDKMAWWRMSVCRATQHRLRQSLWFRGAAFQGAAVGIAREITGALYLSAYHGENVVRVLSECDLASAVDADIRPLIGRTLAGRDVRYPATNPSPPPSRIRKGVESVDAFFARLQEMGIEIHPSHLPMASGHRT